MITSLVQRFKLCLLTAVAVVVGFSSVAFGQGNVRITHRIETEPRSAAPSLGRDLWFCVPLNADPNDNANKVFTIYTTCEKKTVVNIQISGQAAVKKLINPGEVWDYVLPKNVEIKGSLDVEKEKAIHVWSDDADLSVYFMSRNPFTSDGMYVIPTIGWGKEYVVASYSALLVDPKFDLPSEFCVVANQNNTVVSVVGSQDIRRTSDPNKSFHKKGEAFTVTLQRGECVQFQTVFDIGGSDLDLTGTVVTSNNPVGVIGASVCPFIPADPYCDHIIDMLPPVRTWSKTYYTAPFAGRKYGGDSFHVIGSKAGQTIFRNGAQYASIGRFEKYFRDDIDQASIWTSDAPFLLVQYVNSAMYGAPNVGSRNDGDPAMVVINGAEQFAKKVVIQTPYLPPGSQQKPFKNYVNVVLPSVSIPNTTFDGQPIMTVYGAKRLPIPGTTWEAIRLGTNSSVPIGTHTVVSDSGIGVYIYGYSQDDSYAWAGALGVKTPGDPDTVPPVAIANGPCFCAHVDFNDLHTAPPASKLSSFIIDSLDNTDFRPDPNFIPGSEAGSSFYDFCVLDSSKDAYLSVSIYDNAGNRTTVISEYKARIADITPSVTNFGTIIPGNNGFGYIIIENKGNSPFTFKSSELKLINGTYFFIDSAGADGDIPVGGSRKVKVRFTPQIGPNVQDTVIFGDECTKVDALLIGNGGAPDFAVLPYDFGCTKPGTTKKSINFEITNSSGGDVTIDSIWLDDPVIFGYDKLNPATNKTPFIVPKQNLQVLGKYTVEFTFTPPALGSYSTIAHFKASDPLISEKTATLTGDGCSPLITSRDSTSDANCDAGLVYRVPIWNKGNIEDTIQAIVGNGPASFSITSIEDALGNIITLPYVLLADPTKPIYAVVSFTPPTGTSGAFVNDLVVLNKSGDTVTTAKVTANAYYPKATVTKPLADMGTLTYGSNKVEDFVTICNTGDDPLTVEDQTQISGDPGFTLSNKYMVGGVQRTLPTTLQAGECLDIYVTFDPANSPNDLQQASISITTSACTKLYAAAAKASLSSEPPSIQGFDAPATFSCLQNTGDVKVYNNALSGREITNISFAGTDPANFIYTGSYPIPVAAKSTATIPVQFLPNAAAGTVNYSAKAIVTIHDTSSGANFLDTADITGIGQGVDLKVTSVFAKLAGFAGDDAIMPISITVDKHGLNTTVDEFDIKRIDLTYEYNTDLLDITNDNIAAAVTGLPSGWSVDLPASNYDEAGHRLHLVLTGSQPLPEGTSLLCNINYKAKLTDSAIATDFRLTNYQLLTSSGQPVSACISSTSVDSLYNLVLRCGDAQLQEFMRNGKIFPSKIGPVTPNPVRSQKVLLRYATRFEGIVTLSIFDELGKEVSRVIDHRRLPAGEYAVPADITGLPSATYIYRLDFDGQVASGRFVVSR